MNIIDVNYNWNGSLTYGNVPNKIVLHNADATGCTSKDIHQWHLNNGWTGIGYHFYVRKDGNIYRGRPENAIGSHCKGSNTGSIGICFEGRYMTETSMPNEQYQAGIELIKYLFNKYGNMPIYGHKELFSTDCPGKYFPLNDFKQLKEINKGEWIQDNKGWWYKHSDGTYTTKDFELIDGEWYYFDYKGYVVKGWLHLTSNNQDYLFDSNGHMYHDCEAYGYKFYSNGHATKL